MVLGRRAPALLPARMATANILSESGAIDNYTLVSLSEERVSEAGVNSAAGSFGLSFELAFAGAIMLATLAFSFTNMAQDSAVLAPSDQERVAVALEEDAEVMSNTQPDRACPGQASSDPV
jgi:hypothetical protein